MTTMPRIELVYHDGCANAPAARENLRRALQTAGLPEEWTEWRREDPATPEALQEYGSPTVLVDGRDVTGASPAASGAACRADGAPSVATIRVALNGIPA